MIEFYELHDEEGEECRCEVNLSLYENAPQEERSWLLWFFAKVSDPMSEAFQDFKSDLIKTLEQQCDALYAGMITRDGWCEFYFYAPFSKGFENITSDVMQRHGSYPYERGSSKDTKWEMYLERLYPDAYAFLTIQNRETIQALLEAGDNLDIPREVEHYAYFQTSSARERFVQWVDHHGFSLKEAMKEEDNDYAYGLILIKNHCVDPQTIQDLTTMLYESIMQEHGLYEGWSTVLGDTHGT